MRNKPSAYVEGRRITSGPLGTRSDLGNNGAFELIDGRGVVFIVIASNMDGWEHVSVSVLMDNVTTEGRRRCPTWDEMCWIKDLFWTPKETVVQLHVPRAEHVNNHPYVLHMWRPTRAEIPMPPSAMVGIKKLGTLPLRE